MATQDDADNLLQSKKSKNSSIFYGVSKNIIPYVQQEEYFFKH